MKNQREKEGKPFQIESVETELRKIPCSKIKLDPENYAFRDEDDLTPEALKSLAEDIAVNGITTPFLVKQLPDGTYLGLDCHRRHGATALNIRQGVTGFSMDMLVPAHVIVGDASELAVAARAISANVKRQAYSGLGRVRAATRLKQLGMPEAEIGRYLDLSKTQLARDLALGENPKWMQHVRDHDVSATTAAILIKAATDAKRLDELETAFHGWLDRTWEAIYEEEARRKENDESSLTLIEKQVQKYLTREQVRAWLDALKSGEPLGPPAFKYPKMFRREKGRRRLEIAALSTYVDDMTVEELAKVTARIADLDADLRRELREKVEAEKRAAQESEGAEGESPGRRLLKELGLNGILAGPDEQEEAEEQDAEPAPEQVNPAPDKPRTMHDILGGALPPVGTDSEQ